MSASLSHITPGDYLYFSAKTTNGCAGKPVKIRKDLAVAFIAAVNPKSQEGQLVISGIEGLASSAQDTDTQPTSNAAVKTKHIGCLTVCYTITQAQGDRVPSVYITNFRQRFSLGDDKSGLYKIERASGFNPGKSTPTPTLTSQILYISGIAHGIKDARERAFARIPARSCNLFFTSGDSLTNIGILTQPNSTETSQALANIINGYKGQEKVQIYLEGYGAHVLHSALIHINDLSKFSIAIQNPVTDIAKLINAIDSKKGTYLSSDIVNIYPGHTDLPEFNASKVALAHSRLSLIHKIHSAGSDGVYPRNLIFMYQEVSVPTNILDELITIEDPRTQITHSASYASSFKGNNFVEMLNKAAVWP